jgi:hypothetical protein
MLASQSAAERCMNRRPSKPRSRRPPGWPWAAVLLLCALLSAERADAQRETTLKIRSATASLDESVYTLDIALTIALPPAARQAIDGGLPLRLDYHVEVLRVRRYVPDADVAGIVQSYEITYHALSQRYLVRHLNTGVQLDFGTLDAALARVSEVRGLPLLDSALVPSGPLYEIRVRGIVDMGTAPDSLRWLLFWTDDWSAASEWYTWKLPR